MPALITAVALAANNVGVSLAVWCESGVIASDEGALLLDLTELDDLADVLLLATLLALRRRSMGFPKAERCPRFSRSQHRCW